MKPHVANIINAIVLISMSFWAYLGSETPSITALIPAIFGGFFLVLTGPFRKENKVVAHLIVGLTLIVLISLFKPLSGVLERNDTIGIFRVVLMMLSSLFALIIYIRSFIAARKSRT